MKANLKKSLLAGVASVLMLGGCNDATHPVARDAEDNAAYTQSREYDRRTTDLDNRDLPGTYATPREDVQPNDATRDNAARPDAAVKITGDAQTLGMLHAIDTHEMHASGQALTKELSPSVKQYSETLHKDHGASLEKTNQLIKELNLTLSIPDKGETLMNDGKSKVTGMGRLTGAEFEKTYMAAMVQGHNDALRTIDDELIPAAKNETVIQHLKAAREVVAKHREEAMRIHEQLKKTGEDQNSTDRTPQ